MNIALWSESRKEYYAACVRRVGTGYSVRGKRLSRAGKLLEMCRVFEYPTKAEAERRCRVLARTKCRMGDYEEVPQEEVPGPVQSFMEVAPEMQLTESEMVGLLASAEKERCVVLEDVSGLEAYFDAGISYVGYETDEPEYMEVHDRFGERRSVLRSRVGSVSAMEA